MKKLAILILLSYIIVNFPVCGFMTSPDYDWTIDDLIQRNPQDLVALVVDFGEKNGKGQNFTRLVLLDFYNPKQYKIVTDGEYSPVYPPRFSRDKSKILFGDGLRYIAGAGPQFVLYDIKNETSQPIFNLSGNKVNPVEVFGINQLWNYDNSGFYYTHEPAWFFQYLFYYDFSEQKVQRIKGGEEYYCVRPVCMMGDDKLIVLSKNIDETVHPQGYYLMDIEGNYISRIDNPNFEHIVRNQLRKKGAWNLNWNDKSGLFVYTEDDSTIVGHKISVTNLDGSYHRSYTSGEYIDDHPVWGPEGKYIIFDRKNTFYWKIPEKEIEHKIYLIDVQTGELIEFIKPDYIPGAINIEYFDY